MVRGVLIGLVALEAIILVIAWQAVRRMPLVSHAGGYLEGRDYTNSFEAFERSLANGLDRIEVDLDFTAEPDGARFLVCNHDWDAFGGVPVPKARWLAAPRVGTPCDADSLAAWVRAHPRVEIVTDIKADDALGALAVLRDAGLPPERTIVQIYDPSEHEGVLAAGFSRQAITLYRYSGEAAPVAELVRAGGVEMVVMDPNRVRAGWIGALPDVPVYVHTINTSPLAARLALAGADGLYTDVNAAGRLHPFSRR